jgi:hypothetical protein
MATSTPMPRLPRLHDVRRHDLRTHLDHLAQARGLRLAAGAVALVIGVLLLTELASGRGSLLGLAAVAVAAGATALFVLREEEVEAATKDELVDASLDDWWAD